MKYLLFNWETIPDIIENPNNLSNQDFENLAKNHGMIYETEEDFQHAFNEQLFSTDTHQLRILKSKSNY